MVTVPSFGNTQRQETRPIPGSSFGSNLNLPQVNVPTATAGQTISKAVLDAADNFALESRRKADTTALLNTQKGMDDWEQNNLFAPDTGAYAQKGQKAFDLPNTVMAKYDTDMAAMRDGLTADQQEAFDKMYISRRGNIAQGLLTHERQEMDGFRAATSDGAVNSATTRAALYSNDPKVSESSVQNAIDARRSYLMDEKGLSGVALDDELAKTEGKARLGVLTKMADDNPRAALDYYHNNEGKFGPDLLTAQKLISTADKTVKATGIANDALGAYLPKTNESDIIGFIVGPQIEGGDKVAKDGNGIAKFGVNSEANTDVDVKNLNAQQAYQIAKERYYDKFQIDKLPPQMRLVVFDRVFNGYDPKVLNKPLDTIIKEADGDPYKFLDTSSQYLQKLATDQPDKHAADLPGWMNRISKLRTQVDSMYGTPPSESEVYNRISQMSDNPEVVDAAKTLAKKQIDARQAQITDGYNRAADEAARYKLAGTEVPPSVIARMKPEAAVEMQKGQLDPVTYERVRNQVAYGQPVDLNDVRWKLTPQQFDELRKTQVSAAEQSVMRAVDRNVQSNIRAVIGKKAPTEANDYARVDAFRTQIMSDISDLRAKKINVDDDAIEKLVDNRVKKGSGGIFGSGVYELKKVPDNRDYFVGGQKVAYADLMATLSAYAQQRNIPVTDENLAAIYSNLKSSGKVKEQ